MSEFRKYDHLERLRHRNCRGIEMGLVHVFPKLDGTNASVWWDGHAVQCASRRRVLSREDDNAGFFAWVHSEDPMAEQLRSVCWACCTRSVSRPVTRSTRALSYAAMSSRYR